MPLTIYAKSPIFDSWLGSKFASDILKNPANGKLLYSSDAILVCPLQF